ncbi:MAG TPA: dephospho-CoA kinase [Acidimicrobiales bacterium]|nr:dephospho-CoA kinase [Acidimicrobiales bacterium]
MLEIGLTGGIGAGKSTVAQRLFRRGAVVIDADGVVRDLQQPGAAVFVRMVEQFGPGIVGSAGTLDRGAVAAIVFSDKQQLATLNGIVHPAVTDEMIRRRQALAETDTTVVLDIPLLIETNYFDLDAVVVVDVDPEIAIRRLVEQRRFTEADARARVANQASRDDRLAIADFVIDNSGSLAEVAGRVDACWAWICSLPRPDPSDAAVIPIRTQRRRQAGR